MKALIKKYNFVPVLLTFFVMGFCDVVGISTSYVKNDFDLSETVAGFVPSMVFVWFLLLGVPTALLTDRLGSQAGSLIVIAACMAYLLFLALASSRQPAAQKS